MTRLVTDYLETFELGDIVRFDLPDGGGRAVGEVVRAYFSGEDYHVLYEGKRYAVHCPRGGGGDHLELVRRAK